MYTIAFENFILYMVKNFQRHGNIVYSILILNGFSVEDEVIL